MHISKNQISKFKHLFTVEYALNVLVASIVIIILFVSIFALCRPISASQYQKVVLLSSQESYPKTQHMALEMMQQEKIKSADFYRLMYAHRYEASKITQYPALKADEN